MRRILRLHETGLLAQWEKYYIPSTSKCMEINQRNGMPRLSMKHLSSAFVILIVGFLISLTALGSEILIGKIACSPSLVGLRFRRATHVVVV